MTEVEMQRLSKNIDYVRETIETAEADIRKYRNLIERLPQQVSRVEILERCIEGKKEEVEEKKRRRGEDYRTKAKDYKELEQLCEELERYRD